MASGTATAVLASGTGLAQTSAFPAAIPATGTGCPEPVRGWGERCRRYRAGTAQTSAFPLPSWRPAQGPPGPGRRRSALPWFRYRGGRCSAVVFPADRGCHRDRRCAERHCQHLASGTASAVLAAAAGALPLRVPGAGLAAGTGTALPGNTSGSTPVSSADISHADESAFHYIAGTGDSGSAAEGAVPPSGSGGGRGSAAEAPLSAWPGTARFGQGG